MKTNTQPDLFAGGGEMAKLMGSINWGATSLGPVEQWPQSLRTSVSIMLASPYPIVLYWGSDLVQFYNDRARPFFGDKHPSSLGAPAAQVLAEVWDQLGPMIEGVLASGQPTYAEDRAVILERQAGGLLEEAYFTWSYIPTRDETGGFGGIFTIASETTRKVLADRRLGTLREVSIRTGLDKDVETFFQSLEEVFWQAQADLPFALIYLVKESKAQLVVCTGLERGAPAAPVELSLDADSVWLPATVTNSNREALIEDLAERFVNLPGGPWPEPATSALVLPLAMGAGTAVTAVLVAGLSPRRPLDDEYRGFLQQLARQITAGMTSVRAYEEERLRAEQLAELDRAKTAFFSSMSHEFRTPLTLILGPIEDALVDASRSLEGEQLELVRRNALRLYKMVNALLDFSRMEAGRTEAIFVATDLSALTADIASTFRAAAESAALTLVVDCQPLPEDVYVDPEMWEKVVLNLLSNAIKYTHQGEIRLSLRWEAGQAVLRVQDTGVGIPEEELPRIFERFYRTRMTQGRSFEGTGIGLALVQELVELHGGRVEVFSTLGEGSSFAVYLPSGCAHLPADRVEQTSGPQSVSASAEAFVQEALQWSGGQELALEGPTEEGDLTSALSAELPADLASARILVVDDNADLRAYLTGLLGRLFHNIETAVDGQDALRSIRNNLPDLVLSDVMMPGLDGFELVRKLRADARTRAVPVILLSARAGEEATVEGLQKGADDYLVKPFSARELVARVRTQLEMARIRRELVRQELAAEQMEAAIQDRDEFLSLAAHELRTPVTALQLQIQHLIYGPLSALLTERVLSRVKTAERSVGRIVDLVNVMLDISRLTSGHTNIKLEQADLTEIVREVAKRFEEQARASGSEISLHLATSVCGSWDVARTQQIVSNLLSNALKYGAGKPVAVSVEADGEIARLSVQDRGIGLEPQKQRQIFDRFKRLGSAQHHGGLGLGLWVVREIIKLMDGLIQVKSTPGQGATFIVELPLNSRRSENSCSAGDDSGHAEAN